MQAKRIAIASLGGCRHFKGRRRLCASLLLSIWTLAWASLAPLSIAADRPSAKNVLVLNSFSQRSSTDLFGLLKSVTRSHIAVPVNFQVEYVEYIESERFESPCYEAGLSESLAGTYAGKLDLVVAISYPALRFALDHRDQIFPRLPIIFCGVATSRLEGRPLWPGVAGVTENTDVHGTVDLALRLHPDTKNVVIITGTSEDGSFAGFIGSAIDISDQKLANEALETISGKLIEAQEEERSRIARELHDDICQRIALLSMELGQDNLEFSGSSDPTLARIQEIQNHCIEIANDVQALSHKLHSSKLDYLGVEAAIRSFCRELSQQHNVMVDFTCEDVPNPLPRDISLSLFRVTQEALHNALKCSGADRFTVNLLRTEDNLQLEIEDAGAGFQVQNSTQNGGLGLVSIKERSIS